MDPGIFSSKFVINDIVFSNAWVLWSMFLLFWSGIVLSILSVFFNIALSSLYGECALLAACLEYIAASFYSTRRGFAFFIDALWTSILTGSVVWAYVSWHLGDTASEQKALVVFLVSAFFWSFAWIKRIENPREVVDSLKQFSGLNAEERDKLVDEGKQERKTLENKIAAQKAEIEQLRKELDEARKPSKQLQKTRLKPMARQAPRTAASARLTDHDEDSGESEEDEEDDAQDLV
jgi:cell shape-determining protein MreD